MLWKKPADLKYTDLCIYIDKNISNILIPGEHPDIEEKVYNYLWLLVKALAIKKRMFQKFEDYDGYAFYSATRLFFAIRKNQLNQGKIIKGKEIRPIKSCLNYTKALLYPMKVEYQLDAYKEVIDEEFVTKKFDAFTLRENAKNEVRENTFAETEFRQLATNVIENIGTMLDDILEGLPFNKNSNEYRNIKLSIMLNCLNSLRTKNKLTTNGVPVTLWNLPKSMSSYVSVLVAEFYTALKESLIECYEVTVPDDRLIDRVLDYREGVNYSYDEQN